MGLQGMTPIDIAPATLTLAVIVPAMLTLAVIVPTMLTLAVIVQRAKTTISFCLLIIRAARVPPKISIQCLMTPLMLVSTI